MRTPDVEKNKQLIAEMRKEKHLRQASYRERALNLFPHVCARCTREFSGKRLSELTVHHRDHNHDNNPPDGSNWELLCIYCHDHEHTRGIQDTREKLTPAGKIETPSLSHSPFAALKNKLHGK
ncbi:MAG: HNH nuclease family protein [Deltaproteobacteria bacterium]|jgi:5-methylcytosine-specific restriction endonuclease McrA|nr:HNH nuclease family protein [Deltaproteobacteria bacterium]